MFHPIDSQTLFIGKDQIHLESVTSTNDYLKRLTGEKDLVEGFTVTTGYQTSGRGQVGNTWDSEDGKNLLLSVFLKPNRLSTNRYFLLNMSVCLAITDALNYFHPGFQVKWPNDILFDGKKIAGILIENTIVQNSLKQVIVGMGINVNQKKFNIPGYESVTSLAMVNGQDVDLSYFRDIVLKQLELRYLEVQKQTHSIREQYFASLYGYKTQVPVEIAGKKASAEITDVLPDGTLKALINGERRGFQFKEIKFLL